jgi:rhodanese-related sulfurtransferase
MPIQKIKPKKALEEALSGTIFVDIREKNETEFIKFNIPNIVYLPLSEFEKSYGNTLPEERSTPIILACQSGGRSLSAAGFLFNKGYYSLLNLDGGLSRWLNEGLPVLSEAFKKDECCQKPDCCSK